MRASSAAGCASAVPDLPNDLLTAFAYDLDSPPLLHFIAQLAAVPQRRRTQLFNSVADAVTSPPERAAEAAVAATCPSLDEIYGASRATFLIVNEWKLKEFSDVKRFDDFSEAVATAIAAMSLGERILPAERDAALLPFAVISPLATPSPAPTGSPLCNSPDIPAHVLHVVEPEYPPFAISAGTVGTATMLIRLTDTGDVRSVRVFGNTLHAAEGAKEIVRASVFSAAATTYAPMIRNCEPVESTYRFEAEFRRR